MAQRLPASLARPLVAVRGNRADAIDAVFGRLPIKWARNPDFADRLSTSLKRRLAAR